MKPWKMNKPIKKPKNPFFLPKITKKENNKRTIKTNWKIHKSGKLARPVPLQSQKGK